MQVFRNIGEIPRSLGPSVVSIGNFDGVHVGIQFILDKLGKRRGAIVAVCPQLPLIRIRCIFYVRRLAPS